MVLIDLNQVLISNLMQHLNGNPKAQIDEGLIRHVILNSLRSYNKQFKSKYGELVICCDSKRYWRRDIFPFYKINRRKDREKSEYDWNLIFTTLNKIRDEIKEHLPYRVINVDGAEADDVIAVLTEKFSKTESVLILSSDKDFVQLQKYDNVIQYSPILKRFIKTENPSLYIKEHIIKGDRGDGIPNFLSADNVFVVGERQKTINKKNLTAWLDQEPESFCKTDTMLRGYQRNKMLIDLDYTPNELKTRIIEQYDNMKLNNKTNMLNYLIKNRLNNLIEVCDEF